MIKIAPSILSADFSVLASELAAIQTADYVHIDVMDGVFVPNISLGIPVVKSLRRICSMTLDVHLMITKPIRFVDQFIDAGADILVFHLEADEPQNIRAAIDRAKARGIRVGLALKPKTPAALLMPYLADLDMVLIMTVEPGFGGQAFMSDQLDKIRETHALLQSIGVDRDLQVDGGINAETARLVTTAGANVLVAGEAVFGKPDRTAAIAALRG